LTEANGLPSVLTPQLIVVTPPKYLQNADRSVEQIAKVGGTANNTFYSLTKLQVDSSAADTYPTTETGTRVVIFDGALSSQAGRGVIDSISGAWVPNVGSVSGTRNSTSTGFSSVGVAPRVIAGGTGKATSGVSTAQAPGPNGGSGSSAGAPAAALPPADVPFASVPSSDSIASATSALASQLAFQDALQSTPLESGDTPTSAQSVELGQGPAQQADLGRTGGVGGATSNVFKRAYRLATSTDATVCAPTTIQRVDSPKKGNTSGRGAGEVARDCPAP